MEKGGYGAGQRARSVCLGRARRKGRDCLGAAPQPDARPCGLEEQAAVRASSGLVCNRSSFTAPQDSIYPLRMAAIISRSSRSLRETYAAAPSLRPLASLAPGSSHPPHLSSFKRASKSACGPWSSALRTKCCHVQDLGSEHSPELRGRLMLYSAARQCRRGYKGLPSGIRRASTSVPKPPNASAGPSNVTGQTSDNQRHSQRQRMSSERPSDLSKRMTSAESRPRRSETASLSTSRRAYDRPHYDTDTARNSLTESSAQPPPPPPYDILFCGTDFFALEIVRALYDRKGKQQPSPYRGNAHVADFDSNDLRLDLWNSLAIITPPDAKQRWGAAQMKVCE